jgi:hypothetical protein
LRIRFRAAEHEAMLMRLAKEQGVDHMIEVLPPVPYRAALEEMMRADGLLVIQAANCNEQIPAKFYEYLRAGRPLIALTDPRGDTAGAMRDGGLSTIAPIDSAHGIAGLLDRFLKNPDTLPLAPHDYVARASRRTRALALSKILEDASTVG